MSLLKTFLFFSGILLSTSPARAANSGSFNGAWALLGASSISDLSTSNVTANYTNKYNGSVAPPGFQTTSNYQLKAVEGRIVPTFRLLYMGSLGDWNFGFSGGIRQHPKHKLTTEKFDFSNPTNVYDRPRAYQSATELQPSQDLDFAVEPGYGLGSKALIFAKFAYHQMSARVTTTSSVSSLVYPVFTEVADNFTFQGIGLGLGLRYLYNEKVFIESQYEIVSFAEKEIPGPRLVSTPDDIVVSQTQNVNLNWSVVSLLIGFRL